MRVLPQQIIELEIFKRFLAQLNQEAAHVKVTRILEITPHVPEKNTFDFLCFIKACYGRKIHTFEQLENLEIGELAILYADYLDVKEKEKNVEPKRN